MNNRYGEGEKREASFDGVVHAYVDTKQKEHAIKRSF